MVLFTMNIIQSDGNSKQYRKKNKYIKMKIKSLIIENAALCDEVAKVQENIQIVKDERKFLLCKLLEYENDVEASQSYYRNDNMTVANGSKSKPKKRRSQEESGKSVVP